MKRIILILMSVVMVFGICFRPLEAHAANKELTAKEVADYFNSKVGESVPEASCLAFIANGFEALGATRSSACCANKYGTKYIVSTSKENIPIGADVFLNWGASYTGKKYVCPSCGSYCHHVGVYVGDGNVVHTSGGKVIMTSLDTLLNSWNVTFRGWGYHGNVTIEGESAVIPDNSEMIADEGKYIYFGHQTMSAYPVSNSVKEKLESNVDGLYEDGGNWYRVLSNEVYATIPIKWHVLEDDGETLLLLQEHVYTGSSWEDDLNAGLLTWESSNIRTYLNTTYFSTRFTESEKQDITGMDGDKVYLPSADEIEYYLPTVESRQAHYFADCVPSVTTPIVGFGEGNAYNRANYTCAYWTRTASKYNYSWGQPTYVTCDGYVTSGGRMYYTWSAGVRPMMRIDKRSANYYYAPENVEFSTEAEKVIYAGEEFQIELKTEGEGLTEKFQPYKYFVHTSRVEYENGSLTAAGGEHTITTKIYGINPNAIDLKTTIFAKTAIPEIEVEGIKTFRTYMNISWPKVSTDKAYEIVRSTEKDGVYETIFSGVAKDYGTGIVVDEEEFQYKDNTVEENQEYWYKVRGLYNTSSNYSATYKGYESEFSEPVSGIIKTDSQNQEPTLTPTPTPLINGWREEAGVSYWYEDGVKQGLEGRGKEIFDEASNAWYWLDSALGGAVAKNKDVYQESLAGTWGDKVGEDGQNYGKWVRYDENGHMVKGWQTTENGKYYFDQIFGTMAKGYATIDGIEYYFDEGTGLLQYEIGEVPENGWKNIDGMDYWYENYVRQGFKVDDSYRGKEIYDRASDAWYWLDNIQGGAKAVSKDVYQESQADDAGNVGKWVRYDAEGHMIKGWQKTDAGTYYFDMIYGTMLKGEQQIDGVTYFFDINTGIMVD